MTFIPEGNLTLPLKAKGIILFAHGSGSGRFSPRNNFVTKVLNEAKIATFLFDLLTREEDEIYENRFDIVGERILASLSLMKKLIKN